MAGPEEGNIPNTHKPVLEALLQEAGWPWSAQNSIVMMAFFQNVPDFSGISIYTPQSRMNTNQEATARYWEYIITYYIHNAALRVYKGNRAEQSLAET